MRHSAILKLDKETMTMGYRASDASMLKSVKAGDQVIFDVERIESDYIVTKLENAR